MADAPNDMLVVDSPYEVSNWRPLVNWVLVVPHAIIVSGLRSLTGPVFFVYWVAVIFTGRPIPGLYDLLVLNERYQHRDSGFLFGFTEDYTPFDFHLGGADNNAYPPIRVNLPEPPQTTPRTAAFNLLLAIPHYFVLAIYAIGAAVVLIIGWFAVLFTGRWPTGLRDFLVRLGNYWLRVWVYVAMVDTAYPRFGL